MRCFLSGSVLRYEQGGCVGECFVGEKSVGEKSVAEESVGKKSVGEKYVGENCVDGERAGEEPVGARCNGWKVDHPVTSRERTSANDEARTTEREGPSARAIARKIHSNRLTRLIRYQARY